MVGTAAEAVARSDSISLASGSALRKRPGMMRSEPMSALE